MNSQELQSLKNRYDIVGNDTALNRAIEIASGVAPTDLTVLIIGESGVGKESIPKIIHQMSRRRTGKYFAVNCGAIPEGTIDSELFGHEKGAFTGANEMRKGYFEEANGGTLFLDEIGELPLSSQAKLLRVLQDGEFIRVGSSKVLKTDVRVVAATNVDLAYAVQRGKFRADLYYRLNAVSIIMPSLRQRKDDIPLLFRKFAADFSEKYGVCKISLTSDAVYLLKEYRWPGNIRQLKNVAETISALESVRISADTKKCEINAATLEKYIPKDGDSLPATTIREEGFSAEEKEVLVRMVLQLRQEVDYLKELLGAGKFSSDRANRFTTPVAALPPMSSQPSPMVSSSDFASASSPEQFGNGVGNGSGENCFRKFNAEVNDDAEWQDSTPAGSAADTTFGTPAGTTVGSSVGTPAGASFGSNFGTPAGTTVGSAASSPAGTNEPADLSISAAGNNLIRKALELNGGNRKAAAAQLGISERTLYRRLKDIEAHEK